MNRSTFWMIKYMNGSVFSKARYMNGVGFEILARTPVPTLPQSYPPPPLRSDQYCLGTLWIAKTPKFLQADSDDYNQTTCRIISLQWANNSEGAFPHVAAYLILDCTFHL